MLFNLECCAVRYRVPPLCWDWPGRATINPYQPSQSGDNGGRLGSGVAAPHCYPSSTAQQWSGSGLQSGECSACRSLFSSKVLCKTVILQFIQLKFPITVTPGNLTVSAGITMGKKCINRKKNGDSPAHLLSIIRHPLTPYF